MVLVTGGCRSGKSAYALELAERLPPPRLFVATCPVTDAEMQQRITAHQQARRQRGWDTIEEQLDLAGALGHPGGHKVLLVDCLTLWVNNLMYDAQQQDQQITEGDVARKCREVLATLSALPRDLVIFVTNEVGLGVVPDNAQARLYRDLVGRANQVIAAQADTVTLVTCGIPWHLKGN